MDKQVQKGHKPHKRYYCKVLFRQPQKICFYTEDATRRANLFCKLGFSILPTLPATTPPHPTPLPLIIISVKGLVCENYPAMVVDSYFTFIALEKCSTIHLSGNTLLD